MQDFHAITHVISDFLLPPLPQERARAQELAVRERETQELLKSGVAGACKEHVLASHLV